MIIEKEQARLADIWEHERNFYLAAEDLKRRFPNLYGNIDEDGEYTGDLEDTDDIRHAMSLHFRLCGDILEYCITMGLDHESGVGTYGGVHMIVEDYEDEGYESGE